MRYTELKKSLESGETFSVYILEGEDAYFRGGALDALKSALISEPEVNVALFDGQTVKEGDISASLRSFPLMSRFRMTVVKEYYPKAEELKKVVGGFISSGVKSAIFAIVNEKVYEPFKKLNGACTVDCGKAETPLLMRWIKATAQGFGITVDDAVARTIAEYCLSDMTRIKSETEKLIDYVGVGGEITAEAVDLLVYRDAEYKIYEMTDYIAKRHFDLALTVVYDMLEKGGAQRIISSLINYFRRLLFAAISDKSDAETAELLGVKEYAVKRAKEQARAFRIRSLKKAVDSLADADFKIKSGQADADEAMWINIFGIMTR